MIGAGSHRALLRWYPAEWRDRYGDELVALLEDTYGPGPVPRRRHLEIVRAGLGERVRAAGLFAGDGAPGVRMVRGSLLVLCGWAAFVVAGAAFAKVAEHWNAATPPPDRWLPSAAFDVVQAAAFLALLLVTAAALAAVPAFVRLVRAGRFAEVRRPVLGAVGLTATTVLVTRGLALWAHHAAPRPAGFGPHGVVFIGYALLVVATVACDTAAVVAVGRRLPLGDHAVRACGLAAVALTLAMVAILGAMLVWWTAVARDAPAFLADSFFAPGAPVPPVLVGAALLMSGGLVAGIAGAARVVISWPGDRPTD